MRAWRLTAISLTLLVAACGVDYNEQTGGDSTRAEAQAVVVDRAFDDRISAVDGDHTDWKKFQLDAAAKATVKIWWDDPGVRATVTLRDELGQRIASLDHAVGQRQEALGPVSLEKGTYYLEFEAKAGASVYTFEIETRAGPSVPVPDF